MIIDPQCIDYQLLLSGPTNFTIINALTVKDDDPCRSLLFLARGKVREGLMSRFWCVFAIHTSLSFILPHLLLITIASEQSDL